MKDPSHHALTARSGERLTARRLADDDAPALRAFHEKLSEASRSTFSPHACDAETIAPYIQRSLSGEDRIYVLLSGDETVGYFFLWEFQSPIPLLGIGLADAFQGEGLGPQMMELLIDDARAAGREGIELTTMQDNDRAFSLYKRAGFSYTGDVD
ncbi:MAG: N-acetyltransferase family protein, partial [Verrucomicrobiales bacterium]